jgi:NAD(P)-dependent dehydrogenase (short-subunit alcohol dehydrogenase family)
MGRAGEASEIVGPIIFLASDMASYVNGVVLPVDGGFLSA